MKLSVTLPLLSAFLGVTSASLHNAGICVSWRNGVAIYQADATQKACNAYLRRNKGTQQWNTCPDCHMKVISQLNLCNSPAWHIGGDELEYYCQQNGADGSYATSN